jgi:tRNA-2-methylthio-N6-dimethylallyladenosine synthase
MRRTVYIKTFGCQMNAVDSARMLSLLSGAGYAPASSLDEADLVLLNTCSIRDKADRKIYSELGTLRRWKKGREGRLVGVGGCLAQQAGESLRGRAPHVDLVFGTQNISRLPEMVRRAEDRSPAVMLSMDGDVGHWEVSPYLADGAVSAMVAIMQGCDNRCAYCIVPVVRGPEISRPTSSVLTEVRALAGRGVREVVLLGQNVNSYGKKEGEIPFFELLRASADRGLRIRFITSHPRDSTTDHRAFGRSRPSARMSTSRSNRDPTGSSAMGRGYTREEYLRKIAALRAVRPGIAFSSDFIVGFPGETDAEFLDTLSVMEEVRFDSSFSFRFSPRPGTRAAGMTGGVDPSESGERLRTLQEMQDRHTRERLAGAVGGTFPVLVEGESARDPGKLCGRTPCHKMVNFTPGPGNGALREVFVSSSAAHSLSGEER